MRVLKGHWQLLLLTAVMFLLWNSVALVPIKLLVVFFHEASHAIVTVVTGGDVVGLTVTPDHGGLVQSRGGNRFATLSAGYLGSLLIGVGLLLIAARSRADRKVMAACGIVILVIGGLYVRDMFALTFCIGAGVAMLLVARYLGHAANDLALRIIGLASMVYVPYDIFSDTIARSGLRSDARMLAEEFGGTTVMWGGLWLLLSIVIIGWSLRYGLGRSSNIKLR